MFQKSGLFPSGNRVQLLGKELGYYEGLAPPSVFFTSSVEGSGEEASEAA